MICPHQSSPRDTAQEQPFDVVIHYRHHPRAGERVSVVRRVLHGGSTHFVLDQPDGTRGLLPAWMAEPWSSQITTIELPRLPLRALHTLRGVIDSALVSLSSSVTMGEKCDDGPVSRVPATRSACADSQCSRTKPNPTADSDGSDAPVEASDGGVRNHRGGAAGRGRR